MPTPIVSFLMPTFGRAALQPKVLAEAVYWFTQQTIVDCCELIILNDAPDQTLTCRVPGVVTVNLPSRVPTLGDKMNLLVSMARGKVCLPYEDDDVSLPNRAAQALMKLDRYEYWTPQLRFYAEEGSPMVPDSKGCCHHASAFRRRPFLWKYPSTSTGHDQEIEKWAKLHSRVNYAVLKDPKEITYVYRWGVSHLHLSGQPDMEKAYQAARPGPPSTYVVQPVMGLDYVALAQSACQAAASPGQ